MNWTEILTVKELAIMLRVSNSTVYRLLERRTIPGAIRLGRKGDWRIDGERVRQWIVEQGTLNLDENHAEARKRK